MTFERKLQFSQEQGNGGWIVGGMLRYQGEKGS